MMTMSKAPCGVVVLMVGLAASVTAQRPHISAADRPLATRSELKAVAGQGDGGTPRDEGSASEVQRARARLEQGDFRPGDRVMISVDREPSLTDTFTVESGPVLKLPEPVVGSLSLAGVLRSELEPRVTEFIAGFVQQPRVKVRPLVRLAIHGDVVKAGVYAIPADGVVADALMAAGGSTQIANWKKLRIERDGEALYKGQEARAVLADGLTIDAAGLRDGDQIVIPRQDQSGVRGNLNFLWVVVSLTGGIYGLTRALK